VEAKEISAREKDFLEVSYQRRERIAMRFVLLYKSGKPEANDPPDPKEIAAVGKLVQEMAHAGVILGTECWSRVRKGRAFGSIRESYDSAFNSDSWFHDWAHEPVAYKDAGSRRRLCAHSRRARPAAHHRLAAQPQILD